MRKQHDLLKKMLEQQEQLRALQGRQAALLAMQQSAEQAIAVMDDTGEGIMFTLCFWKLELFPFLLCVYIYIYICVCVCVLQLLQRLLEVCLAGA